MVIGVPKEIKEEENRVAITSTGVSAFVSHGHQVIVEKGAGLGSGILDGVYEAAGATLLESPREIWERSDLIMMVKEAEQEELAFLRPGLILYAYLHLAANEKLARHLAKQKVTLGVKERYSTVCFIRII